MKRYVVIFSLLLLLSLVLSCISYDAFVIDSANIVANSNEKLVKTTALVLMNNGFDVKVMDKELGIVTTEYKKIGSHENTFSTTSPSFDYYMQIRVNIRDIDNTYIMSIVPSLKSVNRLNNNAFTEIQLEYTVSENRVVGDLAYGKELFERIVKGISYNIPNQKVVINKRQTHYQ